MVYLARAVQLVAEEVQKEQVARPERRQDVDAGELVGLDDGPVGLASRQERRGDAGHHVVAVAVAEHAQPACLDGGGDDVVGGGLAVRAADDDRAAPQLARELAYEVRVHGEGHAAGKLPSAAAQHAAEHEARHISCRDRERAAGAHP